MSGVIVVGTSHGLALVFGKFPLYCSGEMQLTFKGFYKYNTFVVLYFTFYIKTLTFVDNQQLAP